MKLPDMVSARRTLDSADARPDRVLLEAWRAGDVAAFEALVRRHQAPLLRHARVLVSYADDTEDVVQETLMKLVQAPPEPRSDPGALVAWLHRVARNLATDKVRAERRRKRREERSAQDERSPGGLDGVEADDTRRAVERGLARLPQEQSEVLALRLFGERSYDEIAAITGKKAGTVGWLLSVGMKALVVELGTLVAGERAASSG
ncbi:MAG: sigma-70 family RNA polymerase sigma factor [Planctomycetota bacterium]